MPKSSSKKVTKPDPESDVELSSSESEVEPPKKSGKASKAVGKTTTTTKKSSSKKATSDSEPDSGAESEVAVSKSGKVQKSFAVVVDSIVPPLVGEKRDKFAKAGGKGGRYLGAGPLQAARKAFTRIFHIAMSKEEETAKAAKVKSIAAKKGLKGDQEIFRCTYSIVETTRTGTGKIHQYEAVRYLRAEPHKVKKADTSFDILFRNDVKAVKPEKAAPSKKAAAPVKKGKPVATPAKKGKPAPVEDSDESDGDDSDESSVEVPTKASKPAAKQQRAKAARAAKPPVVESDSDDDSGDSEDDTPPPKASKAAKPAKAAKAVVAKGKAAKAAPPQESDDGSDESDDESSEAPPAKVKAAKGKALKAAPVKGKGKK
jgi:hypothetical protein